MFFDTDLRKKILFFIIIGFFFVLVFQLYQMQILENISYSEKSSENSVKEYLINAPRGTIFDRNFNVLVSNKPIYTVELIPANYSKENNPKIEKIFNLEDGYINELLEKYRSYSSYLPRRIKRNIEFQSLVWLEENSEKLNGLEYIVDLQRDYPYGIMGSHIFGYLREISADKLRNYSEEYQMGDLIGSQGIEKTYEDILRGEKGVQYYLVDSQQKKIGKYLNGAKDIPTTKGNDLVLSIDGPTQKKAEELFENKRGALVAIQPATGEIIAFVSSPQFDLNKLSSVTSRDEWAKLQTDTTKPLFNRATMSIYSPGSTIKPLEALIALENGVVDENFTVNCQGGYQYGNRFFKCTHVHGKTDLIKSIEKSCNTYYYQLFLKIGFENWSNFMQRFGFGHLTGVDIGDETSGILPTVEYYNRRLGKGKWHEGMLISLGIGQGEFATTPIQLAQYTALIANNGITKTPHFVKGYIRNDDNAFVPLEYSDLKVDVSKKTFDIVKEGMYKVVHGAGTAQHIKIPGIEIAGKTGTAENPHGEDHALFIAFAPFENPEIAVAVMVENVGYGGTHAAPIVKEIIKSFLMPNEQKNMTIISAGIKGE
ncbi:MAG: penicillin-binding protein 2 [Melioribacteraceae bacterium]|nr:penicillin-binding protein 2 [Melioribacteraceae bacterium]MCF8355535.1 penicillin-binding protein 2 [Melioribacteraceae bacterium]MCF8394510.1 penicillin-binding protein 2 [Melioribacteraceae bacterium]MCF8420126.1 penicillin-binding protein 2 [Melioribacteraceae bacterium]